MARLTKTYIDGLKPNGAEYTEWDDGLPGFGVRVQQSGRKTYVVRYRAAGIQRKQKIARCTDMPPDKARELARKVFAEVAGGADPMAERRPEPAKVLPTVTAMFKAYVASMRAKSRASAGEVERALLTAKNNAAAALGPNKPAGSITSADVVDYVATIFKAGHRGAADKHRSYIASAYTWAMKSANDYTVAERQEWGITTNPAADVPKDAGATKTRDRNLDAAELKALWQATRIDSPGFSIEIAACIRVLIACGQRVQETLRMDGCEIDLQDGLWRIPAHKTKGGKHPHAVPLPKPVWADLAMLKSIHGDGPLFPARTGSADELIRYNSVGQALDRWMETAGVKEFQTRDLRRTWKSRTHDAGIDRFTRDLLQQHAKNDTGSKNYDRAEYLPQMREAMGKWAGWIEANLEDAPNLQLVA